MNDEQNKEKEAEVNQEDKMSKNDLLSKLDDAIYVGHLIKYNIYLISKAAVFKTLVETYPEKGLDWAVHKTHEVLQAFSADDHVAKTIEEKKEN